MVRTETPICQFDLPAIDFRLKGVDDQYYDLNSLKGENGLLIMFICNHCPYVCLLYTSPSPRDRQKSRMPSSA